MFLKVNLLQLFPGRPSSNPRAAENIHLMSERTIQDLFYCEYSGFYLAYYHVIVQTDSQRQRGLKDDRGSNTQMNYSSHNNTVIFVDCEGLTGRSDAALTDKAPPSSAACCRNRTPVDGLETQPQTSPIDFPHFLAPNTSQHG